VSPVLSHGFETVIDFVVAPADVAVSVTDPVRFGIPLFDSVQGVDPHVPVPPLLQLHETEAPLFVEMFTLAVQLEPLFTLGFAESVIVVPEVEDETVTFCDVAPVALSSSVTVSVTGYVPAAAYVCGVVAPVPCVPSPKLHE
jgi:hypothetical protein